MTILGTVPPSNYGISGASAATRLRARPVVNEFFVLERQKAAGGLEAYANEHVPLKTCTHELRNDEMKPALLDLKSHRKPYQIERREASFYAM